MPHRISLREALGLDDLRARMAELALTFRGDAHVLPTRIDATSARRLRPRLALRLWWAWLRRPARSGPVASPVVITNLFNHTPTPIELGWSVRVSQVRDFRGGPNTYDSHNGTDFAVVPGTTVVAPAPGRVVHVVNEYNRGGLKVVIDHGGNLITSCNHLARALVAPGELVERGQPIALSGYSGTDGLLTFPVGVPHVHFNVWLNGKAVDPFAAGDEGSLWLVPDLPRPHAGVGANPRGDVPPVLPPSHWDGEAIERGWAACKRPDRAAAATAPECGDVAQRGARLVFEQVTYPLRFAAQVNPYAREAPRVAVLDLPFAADEISGVVL